MARLTIDWRGRRVADDVASAVKSALDDVGSAAVSEARNRVPVRTGRLRDSIRAEVDGQQLTLGAYTDYALKQELHHRSHHSFLRGAADREFGTLVEKIKGEL